MLSASKAQSQSSSLLATADSLSAVGNYSEALLELQQITSKSDAVFLKMAEIHQVRGNYPEAIKNYKLVLKNHPNKILTVVAYAKLLSKAGQLEESDSIFTRLSKNFPENASFQYQLGLVKEKQQDSIAVSHFFLAQAIDPAHLGALYKVAKSFLSKGRYPEAQMFCEKGLKVNPVNASLLSLLSQALYHQREFAKAIPFYLKLTELGHGSEFVHTSLAYCYFMEHKFKQAIKHYEAALAIQDSNPETHHNLGKLYASTGDLQKSELHLLRALLLKKQPVDAEFISLALTYKLQEKFTKAMDAIKNALGENPNNERAWYEKALVAEHIYDDLDKKLGFYETYVTKYGVSGNEGMVKLAKRRISDLKEQIHLSK